MKIDIFSGFLGAGKTTLIKKLLQEAYKGEKVVLIENEFGEIGIDGGFLEEAGVNITEMNSGCICCSLVGDFSKALKQVAKDYSPDRIIIEPSGVGKLSDVIKAVSSAEVEGAELSGKPGINWGKGIKLSIDDDNSVTAKCYINVAYDQSIVTIAAAVQESVVVALESMAGVNVRAVNVSIVGISRK